MEPSSVGQIDTASQPINISNSNTACISDECRPSIAVFEDNVFIVWPEETEPDQSAIFFAKSEDKGNSFAAPQVIEITSGALAQHPGIAAGANGDLMIVWSDNRTGNFDVFTTFSKDGGATWTIDGNLEMINLSLNSGNSTHPTLDINDFGVYAVAWSDDTEDENMNPHGARNIFFEVGLNPGQIETDVGNLSEAFFPETINVSRRFPSSISSPADFPTLAMNPEVLVPDVFFAWQQEASRDDDIFFHQSAGFHPVNVSNSPIVESLQPAIALGKVDGFNILTPQEVVLVWAEQSGSQSRIMINTAVNGGLNYNTPDFAATAREISQSTESATSPAITVTGQNEFFVAWESRDSFHRLPSSIILRSLTNAIRPAEDISRRDENMDRNARNPAITSDVNNVYVVWVSEIGLTGQNDIFFAKR
jgi:hypothetical protein